MHTRLDSDDRGVSEVVGAILVFGVLVTLLGIIQTQAVPAQNQEVEIKHTAQVQEDLVEFHEVASAVAAGGDEQSVAVQSGTGYPSRLLFFNPSRVQGTVGTTGNQSVRIENVTADGQINDYFAGAGNDLELFTRRIEFDANYNELQNDPTIRYEYGVLYSNYSDGTTIQNEGSVVDGNDINLIFIAGDYNRTRSTTQSLAVRPNSAPSRSVPVENTSGNNIVLELPSELPVSEWEEIYDPSSSNTINSINPTSDGVRIVLDGSQQYNLRTSRIALGRNASSESGYYLVPAGEGTTSVATGSTTNIRYEVRDQYNNPVSNVTVETNRPGGTVTNTTNNQGQVAVPVTPSTPGTQSISAEIDSSDPDVAPGCPSANRCVANFTVQVSRISVNPSSTVKLEGARIRRTSALPVGPGIINTSTNVIEADFTVTGTSSNRNIKSIRVNFYRADSDAPDKVDMINVDSSTEAITDMEIGGQFYNDSSSNWQNDPDTIFKSSTTSYAFEFSEGGSEREANEDEFFVVTIVFYNNERAIYFISPDSSP